MATKSRPKSRPIAKPQDLQVNERKQAFQPVHLEATPKAVIPIDRAEVEAAIIEHIEMAEMRPMRRRRLLAIFKDGRRPALKENIIDNVLHDIEQDGGLEELPSGVLAARDWAAFFEIVMKYLPAILKLFGL